MRSGRKRRKCTLAVLCIRLTLALVATSAIAGCGSYEPVSDPAAYFEQVNQNMQAQSSYRMFMSMKMTYKGPDGEQDMTIEADSEFQGANTQAPLAKMTMTMTEMGQPMIGRPVSEMTEYIEGTRAYMQDSASGKWYYTSIPPLSPIDPQAMLLPGNRSQFMEGAKDLRVTGESGSRITYSLGINPEGIAGSPVAEYMQQLAALGYSDQEIPVFMEAVMGLLQDVTVSVVIDKGTELVSEMNMSLPDMLAHMAALMSDDPPPEGATMRADIQMTFSDFGKEFDISLPPETAGAEPLPTGSLTDF